MKRIGIAFTLLFVVACSEELPSNRIQKESLAEPIEESVPDPLAEPEEENYQIDLLATGSYVWHRDGRNALLDIKKIEGNSFDFVLSIHEEDVCNGKISGSVKLGKDGKGKYADAECEGVYFSFVENGISVKEYNCYPDAADKCPFDGFYVPEIVWSEEHLEDLMDQLHMREGEFDFYASFTEPFWTFYIKGDQLLWEDFDQGHNLYEIDNRFDPSASEQTIVYSNGKIRGELLIKKEEGSDGMSEITYPYSVVWNDSHYGGGATEFQEEKHIEE